MQFQEVLKRKSFSFRLEFTSLFAVQLIAENISFLILISVTFRVSFVPLELNFKAPRQIYFQTI